MTVCMCVLQLVHTVTFAYILSCMYRFIHTIGKAVAVVSLCRVMESMENMPDT